MIHFPKFVALGIFLGVTLFGLYGLDNPEIIRVVIQEEGLVERLSAGLWFFATAWSLVAGTQDRIWRIDWFLGSIILLLFGLRELDFHKWLTGWNLDKLVNYWNPEFPLIERLTIIGFFIIPSTCIFLAFMKRNGKRFWLGVKANEQWTYDMMIGVGMLLAAMLLDKMEPYYLPHLGLEPFIQDNFLIMEESMELALGVYIILILRPWWEKSFARTFQTASSIQP